MAAEKLHGVDEASVEGARPPHPRSPHAPPRRDLRHQPGPHQTPRRRRLQPSEPERRLLRLVVVVLTIEFIMFRRLRRAVPRERGDEPVVVCWARGGSASRAEEARRGIGCRRREAGQESGVIGRRHLPEEIEVAVAVNGYPFYRPGGVGVGGRGSACEGEICGSVGSGVSVSVRGADVKGEVGYGAAIGFHEDYSLDLHYRWFDIMRFIRRGDITGGVGLRDVYGTSVRLWVYVEERREVARIRKGEGKEQKVMMKLASKTKSMEGRIYTASYLLISSCIMI